MTEYANTSKEKQKLNEIKKKERKKERKKQRK